MPLERIPAAKWWVISETKTVIFMVSGGVATAAGVALYFVGRSKAGTGETAMTLAPIATPSTVGFSLSGGF